MVARNRAERLTFVTFDLLTCQGVTLLDRPLHERRRLLEHVADLADGMLHIVAIYPGQDLDDLMDGADQLAMAGMVLKHRSGTDRPGRRTTSWRKMKVTGCSEHRARRLSHRRQLGLTR